MDAKALLYSLLRFYVGTSSALPHVDDREQWSTVYDLANAHALSGIVFSVVEKYPKEAIPPRQLLRDWLSDSVLIARNNSITDGAIAKLVTELKSEDRSGVLLKGQGAALMYPTPQYRSSGDIDLWLDGSFEDLVEFVRNKRPSSRICYHHGDFGKVDGISVEIHFRPSWLYNPFRNRALQSFFKEELRLGKVKTVIIGGSPVSIPGAEFNAVFMMVHMYRHIFNEGLGLRQLMDYYYVLNDTSLDRGAVIGVLKKIGLIPFAGAIMYLLQDVFGLSDEKKLVEPNERSGKFLLKEVEKSGNFGKKERMEGKKTGSVKDRQSRLWRFLFYYPSEVLWAPIWKAWHYLWRKKNGFL